MHAIFRQVLVLVGAPFLPAILVAVLHPKRPPWQSGEVPLSAVHGWKEPVLWIDARSRADYGRAHLPGALPLNEDEWQELLPAVLESWDPSHKVVVYCKSSSCRTSHEVARRVREEVGLPEIYVLQGGWE